eukprot:4917332-Lingulodinium_polyedra.AAC.1
MPSATSPCRARRYLVHRARTLSGSVGSQSRCGLCCPAIAHCCGPSMGQVWRPPCGRGLHVRTLRRSHPPPAA